MDAIERAVLRKTMLRIVGFSMLLYFLNWLDRVNVGFAALQMNQDLHFSASVYGLGAGIFFIAFAVFEVPSNLILHKVGARRWIARIMISWGLVCCLMGAVRGEYSFYLLRFLLGVAEAGFTPGLVLYYSYWFPARHRAKAFAWLFASPLIGPILGGPVSGAIMTGFNGTLGLAGWQWVFILEGIPTIIVGIVTLFYLPERPRDATWLTPDERAWLERTLTAEQAATPGKQHASTRQFLADKRLWALTAVYMFWAMGSYVIVFWLPLIIKSATGYGPFTIGLLTSLPFLCAIAALTIVGANSDRTGERKYHIVLFALLTFLALLATVSVTAFSLSFVLICLSAFCLWAQQAVFWTLPSTYLTGRSAAAGVALVNMGAGVGGFLGQPLIGWIKDATNSFTPAFVMMAATSIIVAAIVGFMRIERLPTVARQA